MPTYAQLQAESWWSREIVTPEMAWLGDELCRRTGRPRDAAGAKGDNNHVRGAHRSQEWLQKSRYSTSRTYTVQQGLTATQARHVAGFDFTPGSAAEMIAQCKRIYAAMRAGQLDEVHEFFGNIDGNQVVDGWDNVKNKAASSDSSHLWHWHLTFDRRHCADRALMERVVAIALGEDDDDVSWTEELTRQNGTEAQAGVLLANGFDRIVALNEWTKTATKLLEAIAATAGVDPAELEAIRAAAREGAESAAGELAAAILAKLPADTMTRADVEQAVRDAFAGGLAPAS